LTGKAYRIWELSPCCFYCQTDIVEGTEPARRGFPGADRVRQPAYSLVIRNQQEGWDVDGRPLKQAACH
jgi:hypothetical protein